MLESSVGSSPPAGTGGGLIQKIRVAKCQQIFHLLSSVANNNA